MKARKILNLRKVISFLLVFLMFFSQNNMIVFADILSKNTVKVSSNLDKSNQNNDKSSFKLTQDDFLDKEQSNENELKKGDEIKNDLGSNSINLEEIKEGSYTITKEGIYPFTGDWGEEYKLKSEKSNGEKNTLENEISTYVNQKGRYYYDQLDVSRKKAYDCYVDILENLDKNQFLNVREYGLHMTDFYGVLTAVVHENPQFFWGYNMIVYIDDEDIATRVKYDIPFTQDELNGMKSKFYEGLKTAISKIYSSLGENQTKLEIVRQIHDYLVFNNRYGTGPCPEKEHPIAGHLGCRGMHIEHSAYGALVKDQNYGVVCEGFANAFVLLCKIFGIDALYDAGYNQEENSLHAWNYVQMDDGNWYLVDLTYDNKYIEKEGIVYKLFLAGIENSNFKYTHGEYLGCWLNKRYGGQKYVIPPISKNSYIKFEVIYPKISEVSRNVFLTFKDMLNDFIKNKLPGDYTIILKDNYTLTKEEVDKLKDYKVTTKQKFTIMSDSQKSGICYTLNSKTNEVYFPMDINLQNIIYKIESTYVGGGNLTVDKGVKNGTSKCSIYLIKKDDKKKDNEIYIKSGHWENVVGAYSNMQNSFENIHPANVYITIEGAIVDSIILSQGSTITGNIEVEISNGSFVRVFDYGNEISLDKGKNLQIDISDSGVNTFKKNTDQIKANTTINVENGMVQNLIGPTVYDVEYKYKTIINITGGSVHNIIGAENSTNTKANNSVVINVNSNDTNQISAKTNDTIIKLINGASSKGVNATININANVEAESIIDFDSLVIGNKNVLNVTEELDYNEDNVNKKGLVKFNGNSTLKLPNSISNIGSLSSVGKSNKLVISKENSYLSINERQGYQGEKITISYDEGLVAKNRDELIRYKNVDDIPLNNFENGINQRYQLDYDESTRSIILFSSNCPIKVEDKEKNAYKCSSLSEAIKYIEKKSDKNFTEVKFYMSENYEMSKEDLEILKSYKSTLLNQKLVFTSENQDIVLLTSEDVIFPINNEVLEIEFKDITLDFENKNIFASGNNLTMYETVKMTSRSNIDIYGGSFEREVKNSRLILYGGTFNNVYGGGSASNGIVTNNVNISLDKLVSVKGNVYGGAKNDNTGSNKIKGMININLLGGTVEGDIIGGGKNKHSQIFSNIFINYGGTRVNNIYGLMAHLNPGSEVKNITININKNANLKVIAGFNNLNIRSGVTLDVSKVLKYDAGISSRSEGKVTLDFASDLYIPNTNDDQNRKIGKLEILGDSNLNIYKNKYLLINGNTKPVSGKKIKISYHNDIADLGDRLIKFTNSSLASNECFTTDYHFSISADKQTGFLCFSEKTYKVSLYTDTNTLYKTDEVIENRDYIFEAPPKERGKEFISWKNTEKNESYVVGQRIRVTEDISVVAQYRYIEEYTVTLKVDGLPYKVDYVEAGKSYTFTAAPPIPEKYFIGWEPENTPSNNLYSTSLSIMKSVTHIQPGTTIPVNCDLTFDADYGNEVKYDVDYGDENGKVHEVYYDGGTIKVPSTPPIGIKIPFGKIFGGFRVIFNGIGNIIGGIVNTIFRPGQIVTIKPGIHIEAVWVDELHVNLYNEDGTLNKIDKVGKGLEYVVPQAPNKEYKDFLYWKNTANPNDIYKENDKITAETNLDLKPVYKNNKIISLCLDGKQPKYFANLSSALKQAENRPAKVATFELLEDYALTDPDIEKLKNFSGNGMKLIIRGCNNNKKLRVEKSIKLSTDTTFENIVLKYVSNNNQAIYARGHKLEMGYDIKMEGIGAPILIGGDNETNVAQSNIIVRSGTYKAIYGGGYSEYSVVNGDTTIELLGGVVRGDIYGGSQNKDLNNNLIKRGTTTIKLCKGEVGGVVSGTSKFLGYGNSNNVNIQLLGTKLNQGEVYGGYLDPEPVSHNIGVTTITVGEDYELNNLLGFTKLIINQGKTLEVKNALSHIGGIQLTDTNGEVCLSGSSTLIVPSTEYEQYRQAGWINSQGSNNKIIVNKDKYLTLTSTRDDVIDPNNRLILDFKNKDTSKDISVLLKYTKNKGKAKSKSFKKGANILSELVLKGDKENGVIYSDERNLIRITDSKEKSRGFKTIKGAIESIKSDSPKGQYKINLLENYTLKETDISALKDLNISDVNFVITGLLNENTKSKAELSVSNSIMLSTDTKFENIVFNYGSSNGHGIYARGHKLEMGNGITMEGTGAPILIGGENKKDVNKSEIIVESGTYSNIYGGGYEEYSGVHGNITIKLLGGDVRGDIYAGSQDTGLISCGKTDIILSGGTVGGVVSGASRLLGLENSNDVNIDLQGTKLNKVYGGYVEDIKEDPDDTGITTITVEKGCTLRNLVGFTKLDIKPGVCLEVKKVLNHKGGIRVTDESGEVCLNGNSTLISPASHNPSEIQIGWLNAKGQNNRIFVYKEMYLSLTSKKPDTIDTKIELGLKNNLDGAYIDALTRELILLKYENNKEKAKNNCNKFKRGIYLPDDTRIEADKNDGSIYIIENDM